MTITQRTVKRLSLVSRNQCAFSDCTNSLIDESTGTVTGEICHITAKNPQGPRYDPSLTDEQRDGFENLLMMCPSHHKIVDENTILYSAEILTEMKRKHESRAVSTIKLPEELVKILIEHFSSSLTSESTNIQKGEQTASAPIRQNALDQIGTEYNEMFSSATRIVHSFDSQDFVDETISNLENQLDRIDKLVSKYNLLLPQDFIVQIGKKQNQFYKYLEKAKYANGHNVLDYYDPRDVEEEMFGFIGNLEEFMMHEIFLLSSGWDEDSDAEDNLYDDNPSTRL